MNLQEALDKVAGILPGAEKAKQLEGQLATLTESMTALQVATATAEASAADFKAKFDTASAEHTKAIDTLKATHKEEIDAKEKDVEKRAGFKAQAIAAGRGLPTPPKEEGGAGANGSQESAFKTYERLMSEGKAAEASKFYAENAAEVLKTRTGK